VHFALKGWTGVLHSLFGAAIGFGVFLIFYLLGGMGGGDIKLMAGFGALLGDGRIVPAALLTAMTGGVMAAVYLAVRAVARRGGSGEKAIESIPYAPAITAGAWLALVLEM
jgi:prepilin peptidase CpaA